MYFKNRDKLNQIYTSGLAAISFTLLLTLISMEKTSAPFIQAAIILNAVAVPLLSTMALTRLSVDFAKVKSPFNLLYFVVLFLGTVAALAGFAVAVFQFSFYAGWAVIASAVVGYLAWGTIGSSAEK